MYCYYCGLTFPNNTEYHYCKENKKMSAIPWPIPEKNKDFCPHCLRGNIKIFPVLKRYNIFVNNINYILEYYKNECEYEKWKLFDEWNREILNGVELMSALIKKINEENL